MGYADLIANKVAGLPASRQAEVLRYVEAVAGEISTGASSAAVDDILQRTWGAWGGSGKDEIDQAIVKLRNEWEREAGGPATGSCAA